MDIIFTQQGDTWDLVSKRAYNNEHHIARLINANIAHREVEIFPANVQLAVPELPAILATASNLPPWKTAS